MKYCSSCGTELPHNAHKNGHCGYTLDVTKALAKATNKIRLLAKNIKRFAVSIADTHVAIVHGKEPANLLSPVQTAITERLTRVRDRKSEMLRVSSQKNTKSQAITWGWLPVLSLTSAIGIFLIALAYEAGRLAFPWASLLFWFGLLVVFLPVAGYLISSVPTRRERITILIILGIALYFVKVLKYPLYFASYDEFSHWRTAYDIAASGYLFQENPLLPISSFYPGLEIIVSAVVHLTGLSLFTAGIVVIGVGRIVLMLSLYLFYEYTSHSSRVAGIVTLLYMANPGFLSFDAQFAYESLAIPLAVFVLFAVIFRSTSTDRHISLTLIIYFALAAVIITHHITSYILMAFLLLWTTISFYRRRFWKDSFGLAGVTLVGLALTIAWTISTGNIVLDYLTPHLVNTTIEIGQILAHQRAPRTLFQSNVGFASPLWERLVTYASVALILLGQVFGLFHIWRSYRTSAISLALAGTALAYPVSQALRLTSSGGETGARTTEFIFLGLAFVLAIGVTRFWLPGIPNWRRSVIVISAVAIIIVGQAIASEDADWARIPGPYLVSADERSIEPEGIEAAIWARLYLGSGQRMGSDRVNTLLMDTYGNELALTSGSGHPPVGPIFTSPDFGPDEEMILRKNKLHYLAVDRRLSTALPLTGSYFNEDQAQITKLMEPAALAKFDHVQNVSRLFDSGNIIIYDVEMINSKSAPASSPKSARMPVSVIYLLSKGN